MSSSDVTAKSKIPVLDGLRAIACISVLSLHTNELASHYGFWGRLYDIHEISAFFSYLIEAIVYFGSSGVILFFVLSGFLLFLPYAKALLFESPWPSLRKFYLRRIFRIVPGYYATIFLLILLFHPTFLNISHWHDIWLFLTFRMDAHLAKTLDSPFWTLAIEFQFYLLLPIIAYFFGLLIRRGTPCQRMSKLTFCLLALIAWGLITRYWGLSLAHTHFWDFLLPHAASLALKPYLYADRGKYLEVFAIGMLASTIYTYTQYAPSGERWRANLFRLSPFLMIIGLELLFVLALWQFYRVDIRPATFVKKIAFVHPFLPTVVGSFLQVWDPLAEALGFGSCLLALLYGSSKLKRPFECAPLRWIATISFSFYMWHKVFLTFFGNHILFLLQKSGFGLPIQYAALWGLVLIVVFPFSALFYHGVEKPGMCLGNWLIHKLERQLPIR